MKVTSSPSASVAVTVPTDVTPSLTVNDALDVNAGVLSLRLVMLTVMSCVAVLVPSVTVTVAEYEDFVS